MGRFIDLTGQRFGSLVVLHRYTGEQNGVAIKWVCACDCGQSSVVNGNNLKSGRTNSCGCGRSTHGMSYTSEYTCWSMIKQRCNNPSNRAYENYGGRGIQMCDRWNDVNNFLSDMGPKPGPEYSIERRDTNGDYEPNNCYWATEDIQQNNKRNNVVFSYNNMTKTLAQWAEYYGINYFTLHRRLNEMGLSFEEAITYQQVRSS